MGWCDELEVDISLRLFLCSTHSALTLRDSTEGPVTVRVLVRVLWRNRNNRRCIYAWTCTRPCVCSCIWIDYGGWQFPRHGTWVSKLKTQACWCYRSSVSLKTWIEERQWCVFPFWRTAGLRPRMNWHFSLSPKAGKSWCPSLQVVIQGRILSHLAEGQPFILFRPLADGVGPIHIRKSNLFYSVYWLNVNLIWKHS